MMLTLAMCSVAFFLLPDRSDHPYDVAGFYPQKSAHFQWQVGASSSSFTVISVPSHDAPLLSANPELISISAICKTTLHDSGLCAGLQLRHCPVIRLSTRLLTSVERAAPADE